MYQSDYRAGRETEVLEPEPDIYQHAQRCDYNCHNRICPHFRTYCGADIFCLDIICLHTVVLIHIAFEFLTGLQIQSLSLEYDVCTVSYRLYLDVIVSGNLFQIRNHLIVNLVQCI